jgi:DNA topoisomerase-1
MSVAQELYEEGYITYMRTDSPQLSNTATEVAKSIVTSAFGETTLADNDSSPSSSSSKAKAKKQAAEVPKNAQQAHEAIRPAESDGRFRTPRETGFSGPKLALYSLIYRRTLASVMKPSQSLTKTYTIETGEDDAGSNISSMSTKKVSKKSSEESESAEPVHASFRASETVTTFKGFLAAYEMEDDGYYDKRRLSLTDSEMPEELVVGQQVWLLPESPRSDDSSSAIRPPVVVPLDETDAAAEAKLVLSKTAATADDQDDDTSAEGEVAALSVGGVTAVEHVTRPPARYTEASFVKELETIGVGRPSTYAKIFQVLVLHVVHVRVCQSLSCLCFSVCASLYV